MNSETALTQTGAGAIVDRQYFYDYEQVKDQVDQDPNLGAHHTRRAYKADLKRFLDWLAGREFSAPNVSAYLVYLRDGRELKPISINRTLAALRWLARQYKSQARNAPMPEAQAEAQAFILRRAEAINRMDAILELKRVKAPSGDPTKTGRHIPEKELERLMEACQVDPTPHGIRDGALIALAWATGARQGELRSLTLAGVSKQDDIYSLTFEATKNKESREAWANNGAGLALDDWLTLRGEQPGPVFCAIAKNGALDVGAGISHTTLKKILDKRARQAKIEPLTWHDFRRTFVGDMLGGADVATVQKLVGHADPKQTTAYDRRPKHARKEAVTRGRFVPYQRRTLG